MTLHRRSALALCVNPATVHTGVGWGTETLQQLVLVLSDGRLSEKATLRRAVREAAERAGVMLAFIILDNREPGNSVLDTKSVRSVTLPGGHAKKTEAASRQLEACPLMIMIFTCASARACRRLALHAERQ